MKEVESQRLPEACRAVGCPLQAVLRSSPLFLAPSVRYLLDGPWAALQDPSGSRPLWEPSTLGAGAAAGVANAQKGVLSL